MAVEEARPRGAAGTTGPNQTGLIQDPAHQHRTWNHAYNEADDKEFKKEAHGNVEKEEDTKDVYKVGSRRQNRRERNRSPNYRERRRRQNCIERCRRQR